MKIVLKIILTCFVSSSLITTCIKNTAHASSTPEKEAKQVVMNTIYTAKSGNIFELMKYTVNIPTKNELLKKKYTKFYKNTLLQNIKIISTRKINDKLVVVTVTAIQKEEESEIFTVPVIKKNEHWMVSVDGINEYLIKK